MDDLPKIKGMPEPILLGEVGSTAHGAGNPGEEDLDLMGVYIEPPENILGLQMREHFTWRTQPEGVRSGPGDIDLTMYGLRKYIGLAAKGNPTVTFLLWLPEHRVKTNLGQVLVDAREMFITKDTGKRHLGYLKSQRERLEADKIGKVNRPELIAKYGYDTKFAMHALRLAYQGCELIETKHMAVPMRGEALERCQLVRSGRVNKETALAWIREKERRLVDVTEAFPTKMDRKSVDNMLVQMYLAKWNTDYDA